MLVTSGRYSGDIAPVKPLLWYFVLVAWGASRGGLRWTALVGAFLALPAVWLAASAMLVGFAWLQATVDVQGRVEVALAGERP